jgi:hypothetical protein
MSTNKTPAASFFLAILLSAIIYSSPALHAAEKGTAQSSTNQSGRNYLGKDYIDTTVQRAIFIVNEAEDIGGVGFRQKEAIAQAKEIARRLKTEVKGDPNERYALWKVGELEWLIYLEEKDIVLQKVRQGQVTVQRLITDYNAELGRPRPDFRTLLRLRTQMGELDARRADEMAGSIGKRSRIVSRESLMALEKALMRGDLAKAEEEFKYCLRNRQQLSLPSDKFERLETRMSACGRSRDELPLVKREADSAQRSLASRRLGEARTGIDAAKCRLTDIRSCAPEQECRELMARLNQLERTLGRLEDSLVKVAIDLLHSGGVDAANQYLQTVLRPAGVSHEKTGRVDQAILAVSSPAEKNRMSGEIDAVAESAERSADIFAEMRKKAKIRAQYRLDSIQIEKEERARIVQARLDSIDAEARKAAELALQKNQEAAKQSASEIYGLIEKNKARAAQDLFNTNKPSLHQYLMEDAFAMLEATVLQAVDPSWASLSAEIAYLTPASSAAQQPTAAGESGKKEPPTIDENRGKAEGIIAQIYDMLEHNNAAGAVKRFEKEKSFLKNNLDKDAFEVLLTTVSQASQR